MRVEFHRRFEKRLYRLPVKTQEAFHARLELFMQNFYDPLLDNHLLHGKYAGKRSINVTGDYRAIFQEKDGVVIFYSIGTHHELYGS
jgi:mRNA-degrading endonuclease YafQ of YafQ-DinJ toxin-antitoxin module